MSHIEIQVLTDRALIRVGGADAEAFLQGLITNDVTLLSKRDIIRAGLLSPQGKVLFDFFMVRVGDGYWLDVARSAAPELIKRLALYKLRAKVSIEDLSASHSVGFAGSVPEESTPAPIVCTGEQLTATVTLRCYFSAGGEQISQQLAVFSNRLPAPDYDTRRIALGVPEGGKDYGFGELFPHEAMLDQLNGVSFTKGCYVGQEIVSRMQHRGTARSRFLIVEADAPLPPMRTPVVAGTVPLGSMGSSSPSNRSDEERVGVRGSDEASSPAASPHPDPLPTEDVGRGDGKSRGLALIRLDRLADAYAAKTPITAGGVTLTLAKPPYASFEVPLP